jgi:SRSO17 transposase
VLRSDGQRAADGTGRSQLLDHRRGGWAPRAAPAAALAVRTVWDEQRILDIASAWAAGHLDNGDAVLIVDETADEKSSTDAVGAARQLRRSIRQRAMGYLMAVRANHAVTTGPGRTVAAPSAVTMIPARAWNRMRTGSETKGTRHYDWAMLEVTSDDTPDGQPDGHSVLLARRHRRTGTPSFYGCWTPGPVPLSRLIAVAVACWRIEEDHQLTKQATGWTQGRSSAGSPGTAGP